MSARTPFRPVLAVLSAAILTAPPTLQAACRPEEQTVLPGYVQPLWEAMMRGDTARVQRLSEEAGRRISAQCLTSADGGG
jgi:hypothetical protein